METTTKKKNIFLTANIADQMFDDYVTESRVPLTISEVIEKGTQEEIFYALIEEYNNKNRGTTIKSDPSTLDELKFFLNEETLKMGDYVIHCYIKSEALRNELNRLFGTVLKLEEQLGGISMVPGDILFAINVSNLGKPLPEFKESKLPEGSRLNVKRWWIL